MSVLPLGPFDLREPIGEGGMGSVWSGTHRASGVPVAVKLLDAREGWGPEAMQFLHNEVRAVAALHHPAVVMLLDAGQVDRRTQAASQGRIAARTPYLVMELCTGGTLWPQRGRLGWSLLQPLLLSLLDALAHAHARGVVHRDLKPGNVLVGGAGDLRPGPKLTDFGIARLEDVEIFRDGTFAGSPSYAPPEQLLGRSRLVGPWTDLYALGVLTWDLVCAQTPWRGLPAERAFEAKMAAEFPIWEPVLPMPDGLERWVKALLAPRPAERPAWAADAAWSLRRLEAPPDLGWSGVVPLPALGVVAQQSGTELLSILRPRPLAGDPDAPTSLDRGLLETLAGAPLSLQPSRAGLGGPTDPSAPRPGRRERPPLLDDWRRRDPPAPPMLLVGAGLALYSLRALPMVDREQERDRIWSALHDVARAGVARCLLVRGESGVGKSRLVGWMAERANELGVASVLVARHGPSRGRRDGIGPAVARRLGLEGLDEEGTREGLRGQLEALGDRSGWLLDGLMALLCPGSEEGLRQRDRRPEERVAGVVRLLALLAQDRPVMLWLDDLQWASDALELARALLVGRRLRRHPVLVVGTVRDPDVVPGSAAARGLQGLATDEGTDTLQLAPLAEADQEALVGELLRLDPTLRGEVVQRTGGNPLFAVQLVGDWVRRGVLVPAESGFVRADGADATLPDDIHSLWRQRFDEALADRPDRARLALELAAALGERVDRGEWQALCVEAGVSGVSGLPGDLAARGLVLSEARQWAFVHAMARESVERASRESGRWAAANAAAARMLQGEPGAAAAMRRARHHVEAGAWEPAARDLRGAIEAWLPRREVAAANDAVALRGRVLDALGATDDDPRRVEHAFHVLRIERLRDDRLDPGALEALAGRALALGLAELHAEALREWGTVRRDVADLRGSIERLREAVAAAEALGSDLLLGRALPALGWSLVEAGEHGDARGVLRRAAALCARTEPRGMAVAYGAIATSYLRERRMEHALRYADRAMEVAERLDDSFLIAEACVQKAAALSEGEAAEAALPLLARARSLHERLGSVAPLIALASQEGNVLRAAGRLEEAAAVLEAGIELQRDRGGWLLALLRANLGKVQLERGRWRAARASFEASAEGFFALGRPGMGDLLGLLRLPTLVELGDRPALAEAVAACQEASARWSRYDAETWRAVGQAAARSRELGWEEAEALSALAAGYGALR